MTWVIILTFVLHTAVGTKNYTIKCEDLGCVANVMSHAHESRALARLRVFINQPGILPSGNSVFPPIGDYWYQ